MNCPFLDPTNSSLCLVLQAAGDLPPTCADTGAEGGDEKRYRDCFHYGTAIPGGLPQILRSAGKRGALAKHERKNAA